MIDPPHTIHVDLALAQRLEAADAGCGASCAQAMAHANPDSGAAQLSVGGGIAVFAGVDSPVTQAVALGLAGPVSESQIDELEGFYKTRGASVHIELCPLADPSLINGLTQRGYRLDELTNTLFDFLDVNTVVGPVDRAIHVRTAAADEVELWGQTISRGFLEDQPVPPEFFDIFNASYHATGTRCMLAEIDRRVAGAGVLWVHRKVAVLAGQATLPEDRRRGVQTALIRAGLRAALDAGCDLAMACTQPASVSQRNFERHGFRVAYTRAKLSRRWD